MGHLVTVSLISLLSLSAAVKPVAAQEPQSQGNASAATPANGNGWLFPVEKVNQDLPRWLQFGGEFRTRLEGELGMKYTSTRDLYLLTRLRLSTTIQPADWFSVVAETQDARVFFNHHVPNEPPYQNRWDLRQAYVEIGNPKDGWIDLIVGRQVFAFGDERVVGPSNWLNRGGRSMQCVSTS